MSETREIRVGVRELRGSLTRFLNEARQGVSVLVTSHGEVIAELRAPPPHLKPARVFGRLRGQIKMAEDFEHSDDILDAMES